MLSSHVSIQSGTTLANFDGVRLSISDVRGIILLLPPQFAFAFERLCLTCMRICMQVTPLLTSPVFELCSCIAKPAYLALICFLRSISNCACALPLTDAPDLCISRSSARSSLHLGSWHHERRYAGILQRYVRQGDLLRCIFFLSRWRHMQQAGRWAVLIISAQLPVRVQQRMIWPDTYACTLCVTAQTEHHCFACALTIIFNAFVTFRRSTCIDFNSSVSSKPIGPGELHHYAFYVDSMCNHVVVNLQVQSGDADLFGTLL